jgi:hypothetical protein
VVALAFGPLDASAAEPAGASRITMPNGSGGIGFDGLKFAPSLGTILVPGGRTGSLDLIDPETGSVTAIGGFGVSDPYPAEDR